ncbi:uncharacterized protein LOC135327139 [Dromaius novaehollandiae]|uniref:uncharacterized protein LOC135327139 n=1 Tax=Dromaius novaehollandiae TaxID=8790 RepID=UPI00311D46F0
MGGSQVEDVERTQCNIIAHLEQTGLTIPSEKIQTPSSEVKFWGIWWRGGMTCIPPDTLSSLDSIKMLESKKDLQHALGLLVFWRKHIPDFSIIARPLYDAEKQYTTWKKGMFVVSLTLREAERTIRKQPIVLQGPFKVTKAVLAGTPPPDGVAQRASVRKWYTQIQHYCKIFSVTEGAAKVLNIQDEADLNKETPQLPSVILVAPPFSNQILNASSKQKGKTWRYQAVALQVGTKEQIITEGEGSAQVGELAAVWSVFQCKGQATSPVHIYMDSYMVFKGCPEWLPFWEQNCWEVNRIINILGEQKMLVGKPTRFTQNGLFPPSDLRSEFVLIYVFKGGGLTKMHLLLWTIQIQGCIHEGNE